MRLRHYPCMIGAVSLIALMAASALAEERYYFRSAPEAGTLSLDAPGMGTNTVTANRLAARSQGIPETPSAGDSALGAFIATGGTAPYTFARSGTLPDGIDLNPDGTLTGAFARAGEYTFGATVTDAKAAKVMVSLTLQVRPAPPAIALASPVTAIAGTPFSASATQSQGGLLTYSLPAQPGWLNVGIDGTITGTVPKLSQNFSFDIVGTDVYARADRKSSGTVSVVQPTGSLSNAPSRIVEGDSASGTFSTNMSGATWAKLTGPAWLSVSPAGVVSGQSGDVPAGADVTASFSARATLGTATADATGSLAVAPATVSVNGGQVRSGLAFTLPLSTTMGAIGSFTATSSPADITGFSVSGNSLTGTAPNVTQAATRMLTVTRTASTGGATASGSATLTVNPRLSFATQPQSISASVGTQITPTGPTLSYAVGPTAIKLYQSSTEITSSFSALCAGLSFNGTTGQITGTPTAACSLAGLKMVASDAAGTAASDTVQSNIFAIDAKTGGIRVTLPNGYSADISGWTSLPNNSIFRVFYVSSTESWLYVNTTSIPCEVNASVYSGKISIAGWSGSCYTTTSEAAAAWSGATGQTIPANTIVRSMGAIGAQYDSVTYQRSQVSWSKL